MAIDPSIAFVLAIVGVCFLATCGYRMYALNKMAESDRSCRTYRENGNLAQEGKTRNVWDYSLVPGLSRLWHSSEWQLATAEALLVGLIVLYVILEDDNLFNLLGINFGVVIGMLLQKKR